LLRTATIVTGLILDDEMYQAAAAGIAEHVPDLAPLTWSRFTTPTLWTLVPDDEGAGYKAELTLLADPDRTVKVNLWYLPDLRGGQTPTPHSHPWSFRAHVLLGGYSEDRYVPTHGGLIAALLGAQHQAGGTNRVPLTAYHEVTAIHEPGRTLSLMVCGPRHPQGWGYLDVRTGTHRPAPADPTFSARLAALNPHLR
jgi:hypothetical protein